ncbi:MAG: putative RNA polymerase sigma-E factor [Gammaproteobacteria bacterium]|nr:putative RNA polymerase sigma-E factor [Gammaproteobacteria bacterium]
MFKLVEKYAGRPDAEWGPLFHRILQSRIQDWHRRTSVRDRFRGWLGLTDEDEDPMQQVVDERDGDPEHVLQTQRGIAELEQLLHTLPVRQQQAFLLRTLEGLDVSDTARAMACSEGSVKTHYFRAVHTLRDKLGEHWP